MGIAIGIDLGTSNCTAATYREGKIESIPIEGRKLSILQRSSVRQRKKRDNRGTAGF